MTLLNDINSDLIVITSSSSLDFENEGGVGILFYTFLDNNYPNGENIREDVD